MTKYAVLDNTGTVKIVKSVEESLANPPDNWIELSDTTVITDVLGQTYSGGEFVETAVTLAAEPRTDWTLYVSTQEVYRDEDMNHSLETDLDAIEADIATLETAMSGKADTTHTHTGYAATDHTHTGFVTETTYTSGMSGKAAASHTHTMADLTETDSKKIMTAAERTKLSGIAENANNYSHPASHSVSMITGLSDVATSGSYDDLSDKPTIPSEYTHPTTHPASMITGLATVATSGSYNDLSDKPSSMSPTSHTHTQSEITGLSNALSSKANSTHSHAQSEITGLVTALSGKASTTHNHDTDYADISHTHSQSEVSGLETALSGKASTSHTHTQYAESSHSHAQADITGLSTALNNKAAADHTHTAAQVGAAATSHTHSQSDVTGLATALSGKASANHNHDADYSALSHTHDYVSTSGGSISGDLAVSGVLKVGGQQAFYYSNNNQTIGTNNATGGTTICCGSSANVTINGARVYTPALLPRTNATYQIGNTSYRYNGIYLVNQPNVSSDERLKENIVKLDESTLADFINKLNVVEYQYINDDTKRIGLIAQQVTNADPDVSGYFVEQDEDGYYTMKPGDLVFPLICAIQELKKEIDELKRRDS